MRVVRVTLALVSVFVAACTGSEPNPEENVLRSSKQRITNPNVPSGDLAALVAGEQAFGLDLNAQLAATEEGNVFHSPISIFEAMAMLWGGARGQTEAEMARVLHFDLPQDRFHPAVDALDLALASRGQGASGKDGQPFRLRLVNALWGQEGYPFSQGYLDLLAVNYGAGIHVVDFTQPADAADQINDWVSSATEGRITDLVSENDFSDLTRLVLTNAIYFNASWADPFDESLTHPADFHLLDGSTVQVDMMQNPAAEVRYARLSNLQAIEIPYDGDEVAMVVVLPDEGQFQAVESQLDATLLQDVLGSLQPADVDLSLPKFSFRTKYQLRKTFEAMGLTTVFDGSRADLSGINDGAEALAVSAVIHETYLAVDEKGTEAAAATAVVVEGMGAPQTQVAVDRPFVFFIHDIQTGAILFMGSIRNPAK